MKLTKAILTMMALCLSMAAAAQQPLMKTHVETGNVEGTPAGNWREMH